MNTFLRGLPSFCLPSFCLLHFAILNLQSATITGSLLTPANTAYATNITFRPTRTPWGTGNSHSGCAYGSDPNGVLWHQARAGSL
jgi:hypothetical protein